MTSEPSSLPSMSFEPSGATGRIGRTEPRLWTPPLRELKPETSYGFDVIEFADRTLDMPLDPWQQWLVVHMGELLPDGRPRFRVVLVIVARQQGKSHLCRVLTLYWMFIEDQPYILGMANKLGYAKKQWQQVIKVATANEHLKPRIPTNAVRKTIGEEEFRTEKSSYSIAAANGNAGRSQTLDRVIADELREMKTWDAWNAAKYAQNARPDAQMIAITNQGDDTAVVLDGLRNPAVEYIETGVGDRRLGLFEWSCPPGSDPNDLDALAYANPDLGGRTHPDNLLGDAERAVKAGGLELAGFKTEVMCQRVDNLDPVIEPELWAAAATDDPLHLSEYRDQVACCIDLSLAGDHASLVAAALVDGIIHVEVVRAWNGYGCARSVARELPALVERVRPRVLGWFPAGPAAELTADLAAKRVPGRPWPPRRVQVEPIKTDTAAVCMALPNLVRADIWHPDDPMLNAHVAGARKLMRQNGTWVYQRAAGSPVDGLYAMAGAVQLARTLPPPRPKLVVS
jgi:phage terminase large subunit-like protein